MPRKFHAEPAEFAESSQASSSSRLLVMRRFAFHIVLRILRGKKHILAVVGERLPFMPDPDQDHDGFNRSKSGHGHSQWPRSKKTHAVVE